MKGYSKLSSFMTETKHVILKQFRSTSIRDLLYLQGQLVHLEAEFQEEAAKDRELNEDTQYFDVDWYSLSRPQNGKLNRQWELSLQIRTLLKEYYASVLRYIQITSLAQPKESEQYMLRTWINSPELNGGGWEFAGRDLAAVPTAVYEPIHAKDLMMLHATRGENDALTKFILGPALNMFHWFWKDHKKPRSVGMERRRSPDLEQSISTETELSTTAEENTADAELTAPVDTQSLMWYYSSERLQRVVMAVVTVVSSLTPLTSIIILSAVRSMPARLGIICIFTLSFSVVLALATEARRIEVFAATAAFASVQVVFVGSTSTHI